MTYQAIDWNKWHALMVVKGWEPRRDIFGNVIQYTLTRGQRTVSINSADFTQWAGLMQTPPPF